MISFAPRQTLRAKSNSSASLTTTFTVLSDPPTQSYPAVGARKASRIVLIGAIGCWHREVSSVVYSASKYAHKALSNFPERKLQ